MCFHFSAFLLNISSSDHSFGKWISFLAFTLFSTKSYAPLTHTRTHTHFMHEINLQSIKSPHVGSFPQFLRLWNSEFCVYVDKALSISHSDFFSSSLSLSLMIKSGNRAKHGMLSGFYFMVIMNEVRKLCSKLEFDFFILSFSFFLK